MPLSPQDEIVRYLSTGEHDGLFTSWPGDSFLARARNGDQALREALIAAVNNLAARAKVPRELVGLDVKAFAREKIRPMVFGLFAAAEREAVLEALSGSIVFLTPSNIREVLSTTPFLMTAWRLANLYLLSLDAELLSREAPEMVGMSEGTTCYVSTAYFCPENQFEDFLVHEAAHVFHNCKRRTLGLPERPRHEWLLDIEFSKRELFAYACEVYSRILNLRTTTAARKRLLEEMEDEIRVIPGGRIDVETYVYVIRDAVGARNGWKHILRNCAPSPQRRHRSRVPA
jgi:hypothetical protein